jgi:serine protease Do
MGSELSQRRAGFPVVLQHDGVIRPTDCGGPLVDLDGRVVGINIARAGRVESYAVPSEAVIPLLGDLMAGKSTLVEGMPRPGATPYERYQAAREVLQKAEAEKQAVERKVAEARRVASRALAAVEKLPMPRVVDEKK